MKNKKIAYIMIAVLVILIIASIGFIFWLNSEKNNDEYSMETTIIKEINKEIGQIEKKYCGIGGYIDIESKEEVVREVYALAQKMIENNDIRGASVTDDLSSVAFFLHTGLTSVYFPKIKGTYSPRNAENEYDYTVMAINALSSLDNAVISLISFDTAYSSAKTIYENVYNTLNNITNKNVTIDNTKREFQNLSKLNTRVIFWRGHGGVYKNEKNELTVAFGVNEKYNKKFRDNYSHYVKNEYIVISGEGNKVCITTDFFQEYLCEIDGGMFFCGVCSGGADDGRFADILFEKGFDCYFGTNNYVFTIYSDDIMGTVAKALCNQDIYGDYWTAKEALDVATQKHKSQDIYGTSFILYENPKTKPFRLIPQKLEEEQTGIAEEVELLKAVKNKFDITVYGIDKTPDISCDLTITQTAKYYIDDYSYLAMPEVVLNGSVSNGIYKDIQLDNGIYEITLIDKSNDNNNSVSISIRVTSGNAAVDNVEIFTDFVLDKEETQKSEEEITSTEVIKEIENSYKPIKVNVLVELLLDYDFAISFNEGLACVRKDSKYGHIDKNGKEVIPLIYDYVSTFSEGLARVGKDGKYGCIDKTGKEVIPFIYDDIEYFNDEGLARVKKNGKYGFVDKTGKEIVPLISDFAISFNEGLVCVKKDGRYGFMDKTGKEVVPLIYDYCYDFNEGLARVKKDGKYGFVDKNGKEVVPLIYDGDYYVYGFKEGLACVIKDNKWGFVDKTGKVIVQLIYDDVDSFHEGLARVGKDDKYGYIDKTGKEVVPLIYDDGYEYLSASFREGLACVGKNGKYGYIDKNGKEVVPFIYDRVTYFNEGLAHVKKDGKWGIVDKTGKEVVSLVYDEVNNFNEELALVEKGGKYGFVDKTGKEVVPLIYDYAHFFNEGLARVGKDDKYGYIDKTGKEVVLLIYDDFSPFREGLSRVGKDGKYGYIDKNGKEVVPLIYDDAPSFHEGLACVAKDGKLGILEINK